MTKKPAKQKHSNGANLGFEEKLMKRLTGGLKEQFKESTKLEKEIKKNLEKTGYGL